MAREGKRFELKAVDEQAGRLISVIRLANKDTPLKETPVRLMPEVQGEKVTSRTREPSLEKIIEPTPLDPHALEHQWGTVALDHIRSPWGWFVLIALVLAGAALWSLSRVQQANDKAEKIQVEADAVMLDDKFEEEEAAKLVDGIRGSIERFFEARSVDELLEFSRHPDRVRGMMEHYYQHPPVHAHGLKEIKLLQPLTLDQRASFWMTSVALTEGKTRNLILEVMPSGEVRVDWETYVCYQPMPWDEFARSRPAGTSLDFRAYLEPDNFYSHEFADSKRWNSYRLTALDSDETLFGYAAADSETAGILQALAQSNGGRKTSVILRLGIPEGLKSRRGVMIEKVVSPRWLLIDPPGEGS